MKADVAVRKSIYFINHIINMTVLLIITLLVSFAGYALWDSNQIHRAADKSHYAIYKPSTKDDGKSFKELQALNSEVIAWISVYGTNIDYPVTQGPDNMKYVDTNAEGRYSLSGSIFLDSNSSKDFSDYNNILHGHHMAKRVMFGEIGSFTNKSIFDAHKYGNLYYDERDHGIEFFAICHADAYDSSIFAPGIKEQGRQKYLDYLLKQAVYTRNIGGLTDDRLILLNTCSSGTTNGRDILVGKITDDVREDPFAISDKDGRARRTDNQYAMLTEIRLENILLTLLLIIIILAVYYKKKHRKGAETSGFDIKKDK